MSHFKILIVGQGNEGKSSFIKKFPHTRLSSNKGMFDDDKVMLKVDTIHGVVDLEVVISNHYPIRDGIDGEIVMVDLTRPTTISNLSLPETNNPRVIVGNKCDLKDQLIPHNVDIEMSVKTGHNIDKPFATLIDLMYKRNSIAGQ